MIRRWSTACPTSIPTKLWAVEFVNARLLFEGSNRLSGGLSRRIPATLFESQAARASNGIANRKVPALQAIDGSRTLAVVQPVATQVIFIGIAGLLDLEQIFFPQMA